MNYPKTLGIMRQLFNIEALVMPATIGPIVFDLLGHELSAEEREILQHPLIGGLILFTRNYDSPEQVTRLIQTARQVRKQPLLVTVDQEGGRVQRFRQGFTRLPSMGKIGKVYDAAPEDGERFATICGWIMAAELLAVGVDLSFAPVLDVDRGNNPVVGDRAFHQDIEVIVLLAQAFTRGMRAAGMAAVGKHFPGHGAVSVDSHLSLPLDKRTMADISEVDLVPFAEMIQSTIQGIMAAHIVFPEVDALPVGFSPYWLQDVLRKQLKFPGVVFSDALDMKGAEVIGSFLERTEAALSAGCDMALICNNREGLVQTLDGLPQQKFLLEEQKLAMVRGDFSKLPKVLLESEEWKSKLGEFEKFM